MPAPTESSQPSRQLSSYAVVFAGMVVQNLLLFGLNILIASQFGAQPDMDAFRTAFTPPLMLAAMLTLSVGPVMVTLIARNETTSAPGTASFLFFLMTAIATFLAGTGTFFADEILQLLHPWFDPYRQETSARLFLILVWMLPLNTMIGLSQSILNASMNFWVPAFSGIVGPIVTIVFAAILGPHWGIDGIAWATVYGGIASILCQLGSLSRHLKWPDASHLQLAWQQLALAWPLLLGMIVFKIDPIVDQFLGSSLDQGQISQWDYAYRMMLPFLMLSSGTLSTVSFPKVAQVAVAGGAPLQAQARLTFRVLISLCLPAFVVMLFFAEPLIQEVLQRRQFTSEDTQAVSQLLRIASVMFLGLALSEVCSKILYALRDTLTPNLILGAGMIAGFLLKGVLVGEYGMKGIASVASGIFLMIGIVQLAVVCRRIHLRIDGSILFHLLRCLIASAVAAIVGWAALSLPIPFPTIIGLVLGGIMYFTTLCLLDSETRAFVTQLRSHKSRD
ncbi:murein biosynthesis integral membrane protein MurJ [Planctomicrobium sp. SH527]|uniref:murein biosynthesis integral membrane protein MurJ n=1 Tax=Planctomicrobium sp. SH527 TaxID=3448123 RepID=UPI003F5BC56E